MSSLSGPMGPSGSPQRVVVVTTSWPQRPGDASGHFVLAEARALLQEGWDVTVLAPGESPYEPPGCRVIPLGGADLFGWPGVLPRLAQDPLRARALPEVAQRARRALAEIGPVARVVAHWLVPCAWPLLVDSPLGRTPLRLSPGATLEVVAHGSDVRLLLRMPRLLRNHVLERIARRGFHVRFVSRALRDDVLNAPGLPPRLRRDLAAQSSVRPAALELPPLPSRLQARGQLGVRPDQWLIVVASRLVPGKRVDVALNAAALVPHGRAVVLGSGQDLDDLRARFPDVEFKGQLPRPEALLWLRAADVVLSASLLEGAPTVVREARSLGVPVVACPSGDLEEWARSDADLWLTSGPAR